MSDASSLTKTEFQFGSTTVRIIQGDILAPGVDVDAIASTDDNYLTMASGVSRLLAAWAGSDYVREAQAQCPVRVGTVVATTAHRLPEHGLKVKAVLHGAVIDYDTHDLLLKQVVYQVTANCLEKAEELGLRSVLLPAFATGAGGLAMETCARQMCSAIKTYLAQERLLKAIYLILYLPRKSPLWPVSNQWPPLARASFSSLEVPAGTWRLPSNDTVEPAEVEEKRALNRRFIREANLVLGLPYDPVSDRRQIRDFYGRGAAMRRLEAVITGTRPGKRHAVILGGPRVGKSAVLDQLFYRAHEPDSPLSQNRHVARVTFGRVHEKTPAPFIYRKLLLSLGENEDDAGIIEGIRRAYADPAMNCDRFLEFLEDHSNHYAQVIFLIDRLPQLLRMGAKDFWRDLDRLEKRARNATPFRESDAERQVRNTPPFRKPNAPRWARFVFTATDDDQYQALLSELSEGFKAGLEEIRLTCVEEQEAGAWINALYQRYLGRNATAPELDFFAEEAGRHPHLISLAGYALIEALKRDALINPTHPTQYNRDTLAPFFQAARNAMEEPRRNFFDLLMGRSLDAADRTDLQNLAQAVAIEEERRILKPDYEGGDPDAVARWQELQRHGDPRQFLHSEVLQRLEARGYLVDAASPATAQFMAKSFAAYVAEFFGVSLRRDEDDQPRDVVISLLSPEPEVINTLFRGRGARIITAQKRLLSEIKAEFMEMFGNYISHWLYPDWYPAPGVFKNLEEVGNYILTQFTTGAIKAYLQDPPHGSTILFAVHDDLKDIPWELMLETAYAGEIPFQVGRSIISQRQPHSINAPVRGDGRIKALLVGDPTDDLPQTRHEVQDLADRLRRDDRFEDPDVLIGSEQCQRIRLLNALGSGKYGVIHYSGHTQFDGFRSAWQLRDGRDITTDMLTNALQVAPPALVFSSSCESATGGEPQPVKYEDQTFDLPSAFLQAGVEVYIGTLWQIEDVAAYHFAKDFYSTFLSGEHNLGECLRRAKWAAKQSGDDINWPAFILYGDPHTGPGDLFPALRKQED